jgi:hypothetical protein
LHTGFVKKFDVFFQKCFDAVMFSLVGDVSLDLRSSRRAYGKNALAFLPLKLRTTDRFMNPNRGRFFKLSHEIADAVRWA